MQVAHYGAERGAMAELHKFLSDVGLPTSFRSLGLEAVTPEDIATIAEGTLAPLPPQLSEFAEATVAFIIDTASVASITDAINTVEAFAETTS